MQSRASISMFVVYHFSRKYEQLYLNDNVQILLVCTDEVVPSSAAVRTHPLPRQPEFLPVTGP